MDITGLLDDENFSTDFGKFLGKSITTIFDTNKSVISEKLTKILNFILQEILAHHQITDDKEYVSEIKYHSKYLNLKILFGSRIY